MKSVILNSISVAAIGIAVSACDSNVKTTRSLAPGNALVLSAENRAILAVEQPRIDPDTLKRIPNETVKYYCAEPAPDALKVNSQEFAALLKGNFLGLGWASPEAAAQFASAFRESAGELGKRTATVQLIRDLLFRACEAEMNVFLRPGGIFDLTVRSGEKPHSVKYSFDQLTVDVILQMDNLAIGLQAIDGLTGMSQQGKLVLTTSGGSAKADGEGAATTGSETKSVAPVITQTVLSPEATKAIAEAVVQVVDISLKK